jgi:hypothetical protein
MARLAEIDADLARRQNEIEAAALDWFRAKRDREHALAAAFVASEGGAEARKAHAVLTVGHVGREEEARYEAQRAVMRTLETRASIGQSILKAQARA